MNPLLISLVGFAAALALFLLSRALGGASAALQAFSRWGSGVLAVASVCLILAAFAAHVLRSAVLDTTTGKLRRTGRVIKDTAELSDITVKTTRIMDQEIVADRCSHRGEGASPRVRPLVET